MSAGRVALVTGAARGIGASVVHRLVAAGCSVVAVDGCADDPALDYPLGTRDELEALAALGPVTTRVADVRDVAALEAAASAAASTYGGLDVVVACAGVIAGGQPHWASNRAAEQAVLDVDLLGVLNLARVSVPLLLQRPAPRTGRFVAVASAAANRGLPRLAAYCAAKAGVVGFVRALAVELGDSGVTANAVCPGSTRTEMIEASASLYALDSGGSLAAHQPLGRLLEPDEVAAAIAWLAGPDSSGTTGAALAVDGGLSL